MAENYSCFPLLPLPHARDTKRDNEKGTKFESTACLSTESLSGTGSSCFCLTNPVPLAQTELSSCSEFAHYWSDAGDESLYSRLLNLWIQFCFLYRGVGKGVSGQDKFQEVQAFFTARSWLNRAFAQYLREREMIK